MSTIYPIIFKVNRNKADYSDKYNYLMRSSFYIFSEYQ